jgi:hypothetical protein
LEVQKMTTRKLAGEHSVPLDDLDSLLLVSSWFRRHPQERERLLDLKTLAPMPILAEPVIPGPAS